jgi:glycoside/pentoside/hexuronide:cation symporter, GPH family
VTQTATTQRKVSNWEIAAFAGPAAPLLALSLPTIIFLPPYFASHLGIPLGVVSAIFLGARIFDLVIDPMVGNFQDRTESNFGRRRLWLALTCVPLMAMIWFVFLGLWPGANVWIAVVAVFLLYLVGAAAIIAHLGWAGELVPTYHGRTHVLGMVQTASMIGQVIMLLVAGAVAQGEGGSDASAVHAMGWSLLFMLPATILVTILFVREAKGPPQPHMTLREQFRVLLQNKSAQRVLLPDLLLGIAQGVSGGLFLFYFQFVLGFERESQTLLAIYFIAGLIGVPIWWAAARRIGKHRALQAAMIYTAATTALLLFLPPENFLVVGPFMAIAGLAQGGGVLLTRALMADVVDEDELACGARRSGLYFGLLLTTSKLGIASGPITYAILGVVGFVAAQGSQNSETALATLSGLFIGVPVLLCLLTAWSLQNYPLDEARQHELQVAIEARHAANSENTLGPVTK